MSDKTEQPSARRLRQARDQGDLPVSAAVISSASLLAAVLLLPACCIATARAAVGLIQHTTRGNAPSSAELLQLIVMLALPICGAAAAAALAVGAVQTGAAFSAQRLAPTLKQLNIVEGLKRLFQPERWLQVLRAAIMAGVVLWMASSLLRQAAPALQASIGQPGFAVQLSGVLIQKLLWRAVLLSLALGAIDLLLSRHQWLKRNRMTKDEVKREHRESEGDPHQKQERKRAHQEVLNQATLLSLKDADVLIVNPTHIAVGLRYDEEQEAAPRVVAQGDDHLAKQMIEAARAYGIPVVRDIPVARALHELAVGDEIPEELYAAVAEILRALWEEQPSTATD